MKDARFGELRSLLQDPSPTNWARLVALLEEPGDRARFVEEIRPYVMEGLKAWPPELRRAPWSWGQEGLRDAMAPLWVWAPLTPAHDRSVTCGRFEENLWDEDETLWREEVDLDPWFEACDGAYETWALRAWWTDAFSTTPTVGALHSISRIKDMTFSENVLLWFGTMRAWVDFYGEPRNMAHSVLCRGMPRAIGQARSPYVGKPWHYNIEATLTTPEALCLFYHNGSGDPHLAAQDLKTHETLWEHAFELEPEPSAHDTHLTYHPRTRTLACAPRNYPGHLLVATSDGGEVHDFGAGQVASLDWIEDTLTMTSDRALWLLRLGDTELRRAAELDGTPMASAVDGDSLWLGFSDRVERWRVNPIERVETLARPPKPTMMRDLAQGGLHAMTLQLQVHPPLLVPRPGGVRVVCPSEYDVTIEDLPGEETVTLDYPAGRQLGRCALSPDGARMAFGFGEETANELWLLRLP